MTTPTTVQQTQSQQPQRWYQNPRIRRSLARSEYITSFTNWFMGLIGRATEIVLYATVLYSSAQLYPGVKLPARLSLAVFLLQMGALDVGGLALSKLAKQARKDQNPEGAEQAVRLSHWLIGIMLAGVVTIGLEHALPFALPTFVTIPIDVVLVVARSICAVLYGRVVHDLKTDAAEHEADEGNQQLRDEFTTELTERLTDVWQRLTDLSEHVKATDRHVTDLSVHLAATDVRDRLTDTDRRLTDQTDHLTDGVASLHRIVQEHNGTLAGLAALPARLSELEQALQSLTTSTPLPKPRLSVVTNERPARSVSVPSSVGSGRPTDKAATDTDKGAFIRRCLTDHPTMRVTDIQRQAAGHGLKIAHSYISDIRKAFRTEQGKQTQQETA